MAYNVRAHEYRHFKRQSDKKYAGQRNPTKSTSERMSDEDYTTFAGFHHDDELYSDYSPKPRKFNYSKRYVRRCTINPDQTFITIRSNDKLEVSGAIDSNDRSIIEENISEFPIGLTMTLTEAFKRLGLD